MCLSNWIIYPALLWNCIETRCLRRSKHSKWINVEIDWEFILLYFSHHIPKNKSGGASPHLNNSTTAFTPSYWPLVTALSVAMRFFIVPELHLTSKSYKKKRKKHLTHLMGLEVWVDQSHTCTITGNIGVVQEQNDPSPLTAQWTGSNRCEWYVRNGHSPKTVRVVFTEGGRWTTIRFIFPSEDSLVRNELPARMLHGGNKERCPFLPGHSASQLTQYYPILLNTASVWSQLYFSDLAA